MVRVEPFKHLATAIKDRFVDSAYGVLPKTCAESPVEIVQSSFDEDSLSSALIASNNGFVYSVTRAYNQHHHLQFRPEDVWFAILTQVSNYINAHAEELRSMFVTHEGQKELCITYVAGDRYSVDFGTFAREMTHLLDDKIVDKGFRSWIMPDFTTSTTKDEVIASILMMGSMQKYFTYRMMICCGIPSVTLLGEKSDYEKILGKLDKLSSLGSEPDTFARLLRPVISRFIRTFDDPTEPEVVDFWKQIADVQRGSGRITYSGWITAFCFWDKDGKCLYRPNPRWLQLKLDDMTYSSLDGKEIPAGWCKVPVTVDDNGEIVHTQMVAGSVGMSCLSSGIRDESNQVIMDTLQPETGWWVIEESKEDA